MKLGSVFAESQILSNREHHVLYYNLPKPLIQEKMIPEKLVIDGSMMRNSNREFMPTIKEVIDYFQDENDDSINDNKDNNQNQWYYKRDMASLIILEVAAGNETKKIGGFTTHGWLTGDNFLEEDSSENSQLDEEIQG